MWARLEIQLPLGLRGLVVHQHRDAVRVDAGEIGLDHHLGGGGDDPAVHPPGLEDRDDLLAHARGSAVLQRHCSARMPAALMISAHCADSARIAAPNSCAELPTTSAPRSEIPFCSSGSLRMLTTSVLSFCTLSSGVAIGASRPNQLVSA